MVKVRVLHDVIDGPDMFLAIINHFQLPAVQVMVTTRAEEECTTGMTY